MNTLQNSALHKGIDGAESSSPGTNGRWLKFMSWQDKMHSISAGFNRSRSAPQASNHDEGLKLQPEKHVKSRMKRTGDPEIFSSGEKIGSVSWTLPYTFTSKPGKEEEFGYFSPHYTEGHL